MYIVTVELLIHRDAIDIFLPLMRENARLSAETEQGCRQFNVCVSGEGSGSVFLYEVYTDRAAFDAHLASAHFRAFDEATRPMVQEKTVWIWKAASENPCPAAP